MSAIILDPRTDILVVNDFPIEDWASDGDAAVLQRQTPISTHTPSFGRSVFVLGVGKYQLTLNVQLGSPSDNWLEASTRAFYNLRAPWSISWTNNAQPVFSTIEAGPTTEPPITKSTGAQPMRAWVCEFTLKDIPRASLYVAKVPLTQAQVQAFK